MLSFASGDRKGMAIQATFSAPTHYAASVVAQRAVPKNVQCSCSRAFAFW